MAAAVVGALRVVLGADTAALETGLNQARSSLASFGSGMAKVGAAAAASFVAVGAAVAVAVKGMINDADKLGKMAQSVGVPVEQLSALKYAAELSDISLQQLGTSLGKLGKNLTEAAAKPTSEAANAFRSLGVATTDANGKLRSQNDVLLDIAQKFSGLKDGAGKTAVAMAIFGRAGADMIPFLNQGRDGIKALTDEAAKFGVVISTDTAKRSEEFNDTFTRMRAVFSGIIVKITAELLPSLQTLASAMLRVGSNGETMKSIAQAIGGAFVWMAQQTELLSLRIERLGVTWEALKKTFSQIPFTEAAKQAGLEFAAVIEENKRVMADARFKQSLDGLADAFGPIAAKTAAASTQLKDFNYAALGGKNAIDQFLASLAKKQAGLSADLATIGMSTAAHERLKIVMEAEAVAKANNIPITDSLRAKIEGLATAYGNTAQRVEDAKERFNTIQASMQGISSKFEDALVGLADGSKKAKDAFRDMAKGIISDLIRLIIRLQITIPLAHALTSIFGGGGGPVTVFGAAGSLGVPTFRARGGPVGAGMPYVVGERGPELFVPRAAGQVISNREAQGWGGGSSYAPVYNIDARGADQGAVARIETALDRHVREHGSRVVSETRNARMRRLA